jgi:DNA-directed RNA polymerase subunit beta'
MAHYAPQEAFDILKDRVSSTVKSYFPIEGQKNVLVANKVWVDDHSDIDDIRSQKQAKLTGRTWSVPVRAELELRDKATSKVKDRQVVNVAQLPKITRRYSYIVNGNEWQVNNLFRLKSGVYTRVKANGELVGEWNLAKGAGFKMTLDPVSKKITINHEDQGSKIPLYPILKTLGVDDDAIEKQWGKEILSANKNVNEEAALKTFFKSLKGEYPQSADEAKKYLIEELGKTVLRPDSTKLTLGKGFTQVNGESLLAGSHKMLQVSRQEAIPDDRDSLQFKDLYSAEDLIDERLQNWKTKKDLNRKITNVLDKHDRIRTVLSPDIFGRPIKNFFVNNPSGLSERPDQMNPISFLSGNRRTTLMAPGAGGITSAHQVSVEAQSINPSHMGFLDPIQTPEGERIGITLQLASVVRKVGHDLKIPVYNVKTKKREMIGPGEALTSNLAFYDQYNWTNGHPVPSGKLVKVSDKEGTITVVHPGTVDYVLTSTKGMFDLPANMIPFLQSDQGNRTMVASRQLEQAVPLVHREAPLVQVRSDDPKTFERSIGEFSSHIARVDGKVEKISREAIVIKDKKGNRHEVQLYEDFPLNDAKSVLNSTPIVAVGDSVKARQVVADTNFTRNGTLAIGTNLRVAYMPYKGYNFEDGVVISESAATKLTSEHMLREKVRSDPNTILNKKKFIAHTAGQITKDQAAKLDDDAVVKPGTQVFKDDVLIGVLKEESITPEQQRLSLISKKLISPVRPREIRWTKEGPGVVARVVKHGKDVTVYVKATSAADVGDKIVGRHGNKGIITSILPDHEMPKDKEGKHVEVLLNPAGVPSRINLGQVLETAAAKIAEKSGRPYIVNNFDPAIKDYTRHLQAQLKGAGVSETEELFDPQTNRSYGQVLTGPQYILKLHHMAETGLQARSRDAYDSNMQPRSGGPRSGQTMDALGLYAMLAHNARENIREMQTYKADMNDDFWAMLQMGDSVPTPKIPFVFKKFEGYLKGMGIDLKKEGNDLILQPLTDKRVLEMSNGELLDPARALRAKDAKPEVGGVFDPKLTGTLWPGGQMGNKWTHITLPERMPNPVFETSISALLGITHGNYQNVILGKQNLGEHTGPSAIVKALKDIDVVSTKKALEKRIPSLRTTRLDKAYKQLKYLRALERASMSPTEAYTTKHLPVLPPTMRPVTILPNGDINYDDINRLYNHIGTVNHKIKDFDPALPPEEKIPIQAALYDAVKALHLTGTVYQGRHRNSIVEMIAGRKGQQPKEAFFQSKMIGKRQDLSLRGVIIPEPAMSLDEVGLPRKAAAELFKPFVVQRLVSQGHAPAEAQKMVKENHPAAVSALEAVAYERPILLKRDPVLHKFGVQAFRPRLTEGKAVQIHPLATIGYNADFDGDKMSAYVPVSPKAVKEAFKMMPSHNLFNPTTGYLMFKPTHESSLGLFKLTEVGRRTGKRFATTADAAHAARKGEISINDLIHIDEVEKGLEGLEKIGSLAKTTLGRLMVHRALPEEHQDNRLLVDPDFVLDKKKLDQVLSSVAKNSPGDFGKISDRLKDLGNEFATGISISLKDFESDYSTRDPILHQANDQELRIRSSIKDPVKRNEKIVQLYIDAGQKIDKLTKARAEVSGNRMYDWVRSGARGDWDQFKQMIVAPILVADSAGNPVPIPIGRSYSEGLDIGSYWAAMHGARMGTIGKVQGTQAPGKMAKQLAQATMNQMILDEDCGAKKGVTMPLDDRDLLDRFTASDISLGLKGLEKGIIPAGSLVTPDLLSRLKNNKVKDVHVRSPLKCQHGTGMCAKCYGIAENGQLHPQGTNIGIIASHSLGEPAVQLSMNAFHTGGVVGAKGTTAESMFRRLEQLLNMPKKLPGSATLSTAEGKVEKIESNPAGGWDVVVGGDRHYVPANRELAVKRGSSVKPGDALSSGTKNPLELLKTTKNIGAVQRYLTDEIWNVYHDKSPVRKRNIETFVRAVTNLSVVTDSGDHPTLLPGDRTATSSVASFNSQIAGTKKKPVVYEPVLQGINMLPLEMQTDWMARLQSRELKSTILDAAAEGWRSMLHGTHPIPGMAWGREFGLGTKEQPWLY